MTLYAKWDSSYGYILGNPDVTIFDALEILKHLVGMPGVITTGNENVSAESALNAALITPESQASGTPTIFDVLEVLKYLVGMPSLVG